MKKLYLINIFLIVALFYSGIHLNEEEKAFLAGLRVDGDSYEWASKFYAGFAILCTFFSAYVGFKTIDKKRFAGVLLLVISGLGLLYALAILFNPSIYRMEDALRVFGPYIVLGMWLNAYIFFYVEEGTFEDALAS